MKTIKYFAMAAIALVMASCNGNEKAGDFVTLDIEETNMGSFSNYGSFSGEVKLKLNATIEKTEEGAVYNVSLPLRITSDVAWKYNLQFLLTVADEDHSTIKRLGYLTVEGEYDFDTDSNYLVSGDIRQEFNVRLTDEDWKAIQEGGKYLVITSNTDSNDICSHSGSKASSTSYTSDDNDDSYSDDEDWDAILDSYEEYVDDYISLLKKANNGDMDALSEYPSLLESAQELGDKLQNAEGSMSSSQWSRYMKINNKMSQAAIDM